MVVHKESFGRKLAFRAKTFFLKHAYLHTWNAELLTLLRNLRQNSENMSIDFEKNVDLLVFQNKLFHSKNSTGQF